MRLGHLNFGQILSGPPEATLEMVEKIIIYGPNISTNAHKCTFKDCPVRTEYSQLIRQLVSQVTLLCDIGMIQKF